MDAPVFARFATFGDETFQQVSDRTGLALELLLQIRESTGGATPDPGDRMRESELPVIPFIQAQLDIGFRPVSIGRWLRVAGDSLRRMAETGIGRLAHGPDGAGAGAGRDGGGAGPDLFFRESLRLDETTNEALVALWHARQVHTWTNNVISGFEQALTAAGMLTTPARPPAICFLDITGYTRLTNERGDDAAADLAQGLSTLVQRVRGRPRRAPGEMAGRRRDGLLPRRGTGRGGGAGHGRWRGGGRVAARARGPALRAGPVPGR